MAKEGLFQMMPRLSVHKGNLDAALHRNGEPPELSPSLTSAFLDPAGTETTLAHIQGLKGKGWSPGQGWVSSSPESGPADWAQRG